MTEEEKQRDRLRAKGMDDSEIERTLLDLYGDKYVGTGKNTGTEFKNSSDSFVDFVRSNSTIGNPETALGVQRALTGGNNSTGASFIDKFTIKKPDVHLPDLSWLKKLFVNNKHWEKTGNFLKRDN